MLGRKNREDALYDKAYSAEKYVFKKLLQLRNARSQSVKHERRDVSVSPRCLIMLKLLNVIIRICGA